ncbi:MAG TPA: HAD-IIIC family phosphatase [Caulobacteraceae bacterium]|nr:HAD-IIIC family phosphatase [Caulobacteraceae bacterium]
MRLRSSSFVHKIPVGPDRVLLVHAISHLRFLANDEIARVFDFFAEPRTLPDEALPLMDALGCDRDALARCIGALMERGVLTEQDPAAEAAQFGALMSASYGRDPRELLERYRRETQEGGLDYWATGAASALADFAEPKARIDAILFGDCDVHMEAGFLRREAAGRGIDLRVAATFPDDASYAAEHRHDVILIGALRGRHTIVEPAPGHAPHDAYTAEATRLITALRTHTSAPILIDNLPEPTVQPLGMAERGIGGHRNRFRLANLNLAELVERFADVHVVDAAAALAAAGSERMLDDGQVGFTHFGSPGWMLQRPESETAAVHGIVPDPAGLAAAVGGDPYGREAVMARVHVDALMTALGTDRKKCVIVDLDGVLWPGVLAETGAPFAWTPEISGPYSHIGLWFGLHEALLALKRRGVLLACVSKNDEAVVRELWTYPDHYPRERLLTPDDFVAWRVNWTDKVDNIRSIAEELGFAPSAFLFIDDRPDERDRVRQRLPEVEVWGEDLHALRRRLLTDPRLQLPRLTDEAGQRTDLVKAQLVRQRLRADTMGEAEYRASLNVKHAVRRLRPGDGLDRVVELFQRTTQFNATGRRFGVAELEAMLADPAQAVFSLTVSDRFGDHGLTGAIVVSGAEIVGLAVSCRVLGLGVEQAFLAEVTAALAPDHPQLVGRIVETARNAPVRNVYRDAGFALGDDGAWRLQAAAERSAA